MQRRSRRESPYRDPVQELRRDAVSGPTNVAITGVANQYAGINANAYNASVNDPGKLTVKVNATDIDARLTFTAGGPCTGHGNPPDDWLLRLTSQP